MCPPVLPGLAAVGSFLTSSAGLATLAVAGTAASLYTQARSAAAQEEAIREQLAMVEAEALDTETAEVNDRLRAMRKEQARTRVAAGEAGLQLGGSIELLLKDSLMQAAVSRERTSQNAERERMSARAEANSMLSRVERPTALGAGLQLVSSGVSGWSTGKSIAISRENAAKQIGRGS
ncbi:hypothetical protein [Phenylobacterium sp.]|uniref:virion core protein, T7 gp14 family n=1 Tax=Phenylobacterium sp. TaxID=1871053 RepID=UPI00393FC404